MLDDVDFPTNVTFLEALQHYKSLYPRANSITKIKLKCWLYYCESRNEGGKNSMSFTHFKKSVDFKHYFDMVHLYVIDCSDIGGNEKALELLWNYESLRQK